MQRVPKDLPPTKLQTKIVSMNAMHRQSLIWGALFLSIGFFCVFELTRFVPLFTDEISYKILYARYFLDKGVAPTLFPTCRMNLISYFPWSFVPFKVVESLIYQDLSFPLKLRYFGMFYFLIYLGLAYLLTEDRFKNLKDWSSLKSIIWVLGLSSLGILPFIMVLNRPELPVLIFLMVLMALTAKDSSWLSRSKFSAALGTVFYFLCVLGLFSYHPKLLFFTPFMLAVGFLVFKNRLQQILIAAGVLVSALHSFVFWKELISCPLDSKLRASLASNTISNLNGPLRIGEVIRQLLFNLKSSVDYFGFLRFSGGSSSFYLPYLGKNELMTNPFLALCFKLWNGCFGFLILSLAGVVSFSFAVRVISIFKKRARLSESLIFFSLLISFLTLLAMTIRKTFYDSTLIVPLFFILCMEAFPKLPEVWREKIMKILLPGVLILGLASQCILLANYSKFRGEWTLGGDIPGSLFGSSGYHSEEINHRVVKLGQKCGIFPNSGVKHVILDELSYPSYWKTSEPYHALFLPLGRSEQELSYLNSFLRQHQSGGYLARCRHLVEKWAEVAKRDGDMCCIPAFSSGDGLK